MEIVGVVDDVKAGNITGPLVAAIYHPHQQAIRQQMTFLIRTASEPEALLQSARKRLLEIDPDQPISNLQVMSDVVDQRLGFNRMTMQLVGAFAGVALFLAALGVYGVISYSVSQRTREIGIRMALGAGQRQVFGMVLQQGCKLTVSGVVLGLGVAAGATRLLSALLVGVTPYDLTSFATMTLILILAALLACVLPARRASRVDPVVAQRV